MHQHQHSEDKQPAELFTPAPSDAQSPSTGAAASRERTPGAGATGHDLAALSQLLVARLPTLQAIQRALALGLRLLPECRALQLFAIEDASGRRLDLLGEADVRSVGVREQTARATSAPNEPNEPNEPGEPGEPGMTETLGYGAQADGLVLEARKQARIGDVLLVPLLTARDTLAGALALKLAATRKDTATRPAASPASAVSPVAPALLASPGFQALSATLTVLAERWQNERTAVRQSETLAAEARSRDAFISHAAHELRSPLTSLKGYAQLLLRQARKTNLPSSMLRSAEAIDEQTARMAEMVGELLDASRIQRGILALLPPTRVDLVELASRVVERRRVIAPDQQIVLASDEPALLGNWDEPRVEQILRDLLDNALRFSPHGTPTTVRLGRDDGMARVLVRDDGIGIEEQEQARIFDYLYRTPGAERRNLAGLGLGLFVSRHLAERMDGRLLLRRSSTDDPSGSEFELLLPLAADA